MTRRTFRGLRFLVASITGTFNYALAWCRQFNQVMDNLSDNADILRVMILITM